MVEAVDRLRIVRLERHFAEQIQLVGLADVLAGEVNDPLAEVGLGGMQEFQVFVDFRFGELVERFVDERGELDLIRGRVGEGPLAANRAQQRGNARLADRFQHRVSCRSLSADDVRPPIINIVARRTSRHPLRNPLPEGEGLNGD